MINNDNIKENINPKFLARIQNKSLITLNSLLECNDRT